VFVPTKNGKCIDLGNEWRWRREQQPCYEKKGGPEAAGILIKILKLLFKLYFYFFEAFFFPKLVSTVAPMLASICFAGSAN